MSCTFTASSLDRHEDLLHAPHHLDLLHGDQVGETAAGVEHDEFAVLSILALGSESSRHDVQPVRVAVTGRTESPGIFEVLEILGKEKTLKRLARAIQMIEMKS